MMSNHDNSSARSLEALNAVVQHTECEELKRLKEENARLREALEFVQTSAIEKARYNDRLVWFARSRNHDAKAAFLEDSRRELGEQKFQKLMQHIEDLRSEGGDFNHGFNSGCLATSRLFAELTSITEPHVWENENEYEYEHDDDDDEDTDMEDHRHVESVEDQRNEALSRFPNLDT
jgi:hypothetical protein